MQTLLGLSEAGELRHAEVFQARAPSQRLSLAQSRWGHSEHIEVSDDTCLRSANSAGASLLGPGSLMSKTLASVILLTALAWGGTAAADPCTAIPPNGPTPSYLAPGSKFSGPVTYIGDGDSLCVAVGGDQSSWVEVRSDFNAPELAAPGGAEARAALEAVALWKRASCTAGQRTHDRVAAQCSIDGRSIASSLRAVGAKEGGNGRKPRPAAALPVVSRGRDASEAFRNCAEARAAGAAPLRLGQPGYGAHMDGDGDGIACEPYRRR